MNERFLEIIRFCFVGGLSLIVDCAVLYGLTEFFGVHYLYSAAIFIGSSVAGLGLNQLCMWFFVEIIFWHYMLAKLGATVIVTIWNYVMKRKAING